MNRILKRLLPLFLAATLLFALTGCRESEKPPSPPESASPSQSALPTAPSPAESAPPAEPSPSGSPSQSPQPTESQSPAPSEDPLPEERYFFAGGFFLGSWGPGGWRSVHNSDFTLGEVLNNDFYTYTGETVGAVRLYLGDGPGSFTHPAEARALLSPYGIREGDDLVMELPVPLTGEAAELFTPRYSFHAMFDGTIYDLLSTVPLSRPETVFIDDLLPEEKVTTALFEAGILCHLDRMDREARAFDADGDGKIDFTLELIQPNRDEGGYLVLEEGDPIFYAILYSDGETVTAAACRGISYTTDVTAHFAADFPSVYDLNGDGMPELIFRVGEWESGCTSAYSLVNGHWTEVLRQEFGS